ncbi:DoxX family protein [Vibrio tasmaniensis]|uniref:DoxX family protein n=1 Tax=Vibrio tasmaniensis TaxID=212663 RepID=UPI001118FF56|nr:DoxX family protein [Vibrio tasmaniensis]
MDRYLLITGRVLLALYFLLPGIMKFTAWDGHLALMEKHGMIMIPFLLALAAICQITSSLMIIANRYVAIAAIILAVLVLIINVNLHDFWNFTGTDAGHEKQNFIKNIAIFAGLLILSGLTWKDTFTKTKI